MRKRTRTIESSDRAGNRLARGPTTCMLLERTGGTGGKG